MHFNKTNFNLALNLGIVCPSKHSKLGISCCFYEHNNDDNIVQLWSVSFISSKVDSMLKRWQKQNFMSYAFYFCTKCLLIFFFRINSPIMETLLFS